MTEPTQAQIEAAAKALRDMWCGGRGDNPAFEFMAKTALTAVAGVGHREVPFKHVEIEDPAAGVGEDLAEAKTAAFQYGVELATPATIERCAQELEAAYAECNTLNLLHGAARLRALKDKPSYDPTADESRVSASRGRRWS